MSYVPPPPNPYLPPPTGVAPGNGYQYVVQAAKKYVPMAFKAALRNLR